ncbi:MAG TPA: NAD kinase [Flavobacteriales bacterium]|nr:NAD kinase [Flavobacteriales bacterium]
MKFGIFCNYFSDQNLFAVNSVRQMLDEAQMSYCVNTELKKRLKNTSLTVFSNKAELVMNADILVTVGGDGTILRAVQYVAGSEIPVLGINTGRLGFLTSITLNEIPNLLDEIKRNIHRIEERGLLEVRASDQKNEDVGLAFNELSVQKKDSSAMITIHTELDGEFLNSYWADGLIVATVTGSTAYSLSCGGPVVMPGSGNIIITPIAPHNLNVRPLIVDDCSQIRLWFETRSNDLLIALDSNSRIIQDNVSIHIKKSDTTIKLLRQESYSYLETLRNKLNWGLDKRN